MLGIVRRHGFSKLKLFECRSVILKKNPVLNGVEVGVEENKNLKKNFRCKLFPQDKFHSKCFLRVKQYQLMMTMYKSYEFSC